MKETNSNILRSRGFWQEDKRDSHSLDEFLTGTEHSNGQEIQQELQETWLHGARKAMETSPKVFLHSVDAGVARRIDWDARRIDRQQHCRVSQQSTQIRALRQEVGADPKCNNEQGRRQVLTQSPGSAEPILHLVPHPLSHCTPSLTCNEA